MDRATLHCPSCGDEYVAGSQVCAACRVALVAGAPEPGDELQFASGLPEGYVELGAWPPLATVMIVRRLTDAGVEVSSLWSDPTRGGLAALAVPEPQVEFADAVLRELPIEEELPHGTSQAYLDRIETRLAEIGVLLDELRQLDPEDDLGVPGTTGPDPW